MTADDSGIVSGHAYTITDAQVVHLEKKKKVVKLLRVRNPWGNATEWQGDWSDKYENKFIYILYEDFDCYSAFQQDKQSYVSSYTTQSNCSFTNIQNNFWRLERMILFYTFRVKYWIPILFFNGTSRAMFLITRPSLTIYINKNHIKFSVD